MWKSKRIEVPAGFNFGLTARSHGWYDLPPFHFDEDSQGLTYVFLEGQYRKAVNGTIKCDGEWITITLERPVSNGSRIEAQVKHILRFDDQIEGFYAAVKGHDRLSWAARNGAGRLLRSPTVFEDLVKTLCTTNCSWGLTRNMVTNLVSELGTVSRSGDHAFPLPDDMARKDEAYYRSVVKAGYRAPYFVELARSVASGKLDPESWLDPEIPTPELKNKIKSVKGIGDYAAENLLKLLGRYDGLALDSWLRAQFYKKFNRGKTCSDKKIEKAYTGFKEWKGLAIWCDMTEDWHQSKNED